MCIQPGIIC